ncbi:hypothetical protein ASE85_07370 [Sphingobium sp. Leaf26]|nr:hypothetical protein ASE85_07370 [Sphingobium sp. Leaf26]
MNMENLVRWSRVRDPKNFLPVPIRGQRVGFDRRGARHRHPPRDGLRGYCGCSLYMSFKESLMTAASLARVAG